MTRAHRSTTRSPLLIVCFIAGALLMLALVVAGCASDRTAQAIQANEDSIAQARAELRFAEAQLERAETDLSRERWQREVEALRGEIGDRETARDSLVREHDDADARDAQAWGDVWSMAGTALTVAGLPVGGAIGGVIGTLRGRRTGASILAKAIAFARRSSADFDAVFRDDTSPAVQALRQFTPAEYAAVIREANLAAGVPPTALLDAARPQPSKTSA